MEGSAGKIPFQPIGSKHQTVKLGQHRTMGTAGFGGSFAPIVQYEKWEIHPVFPHFSYFRLCQNLSPNLLAPLCGAALDSLRAAPPARYRSVVRQIGIWRTVRTCHCEPARTLVWQSPSSSGQPIVIQAVLFAPFSGLHPQKVVLLTGRLPRQCALLYRNDLRIR